MPGKANNQTKEFKEQFRSRKVEGRKEWLKPPSIKNVSKKKTEIQHGYPTGPSSYHIVENAEDKRDTHLAEMVWLCQAILTATESHQEES